MSRVKVKVERGNGLQQVVVIDPSATRGAEVGSSLYLNGAVATPAALRAWLGVSASGANSSGGSSAFPLSKTNDTNVTLTLGGSPGAALNAAVVLQLGWAGTLAKSRGGFGEDASSLVATLAELNYVQGVTSAIQTQLDSKQPSNATLSTLAGLTDAPGVLTNDGAGNLSWA